MATLNVGSGQTYTTIQAAIDAAGAGDTIIVADSGVEAPDYMLANMRPGIEGHRFSAEIDAISALAEVLQGEFSIEIIHRCFGGIETDCRGGKWQLR